MIEITEVRIRKIKTNNRIVALATIEIDNCFIVNEVKVLKGENGLFIAMPSRKTSNGDRKSVV